MLPLTFDLQEHTPLELHDVEVDPEVLHPQAEKMLMSPTLSSLIDVPLRLFFGVKNSGGTALFEGGTFNKNDGIFKNYFGFEINIV